MYQAEEDPAEKQRIGEALEAQGYFSAAVPLSWEYQDYMRTYCHLYGCPYPLALAVADWETRGQFNMDAIGPAGEVGIMQLNPGPDGSYHAELEDATGLDPTTPEGNIAGGCYKLGKYMAEYGDAAMVAMAYNRSAVSPPGPPPPGTWPQTPTGRSPPPARWSAGPPPRWRSLSRQVCPFPPPARCPLP